MNPKLVKRPREASQDENVHAVLFPQQQQAPPSQAPYMLFFPTAPVFVTGGIPAGGPQQSAVQSTYVASSSTDHSARDTLQKRLRSRLNKDGLDGTQHVPVSETPEPDSSRKSSPRKITTRKAKRPASGSKPEIQATSPVVEHSSSSSSHIQSPKRKMPELSVNTAPVPSQDRPNLFSVVPPSIAFTGAAIENGKPILTPIFGLPSPTATPAGRRFSTSLFSPLFQAPIAFIPGNRFTAKNISTRLDESFEEVSPLPPPPPSSKNESDKTDKKT